MSPLNLCVLDNANTSAWLKGEYSSVRQTGGSITCVGEIHSNAGSIFRFEDIYLVANTADAIELSRKVTVTHAGGDAGFLSRFQLRSSTDFSSNDYFVPGIWYGDNRLARPGAMGTSSSHEFFIIREDRMPLPMVMMRDKHGGATITLVHLQPDGSTCLPDYAAQRVIDQRIQVASLGVFSRKNTAVSLYFPASEGQRSYIRSSAGQRRNREAGRWVERFHPVKQDMQHGYKMLIHVSEHDKFPRAMRQAWRVAYQNVPRPKVTSDIPACYEASISLVADWSQTTKGAAGLPFRLRLPDGGLEDAEMINYQMGFVGQQLPLAYHLLRYGLIRDDTEIRRKGEAMVDFWAANSATDQGLPRTWFDTFPEPHWRKYNTFMRVASDGMGGALMAWDVMKKHGHSRPDWLAFCIGFADWLVTYQNEDGSWFREYNWDSTAAHQGKGNTTNPIPFLIDLSKATGSTKYRDAALKAGEYCWRNIHEKFAYVGGTPDNPNVMDKEAGFLAIDAFLALWDVTGDRRWLGAAAQAADFTETWAYCWEIPIPQEDTEATYPRSATTTGMSIIATGHSGADLFLAGAPFLYYRLYLGTGDQHYADIARQLLHHPRQSVDIDGSLGYGHTGLCTEALTLSPSHIGRGHGVNRWLPWISHSMINPIVQLEEVYGLADTPVVSGQQLDQLRAKDREYGQSRGLFSSRNQANRKTTNAN